MKHESFCWCQTCSDASLGFRRYYSVMSDVTDVMIVTASKHDSTDGTPEFKQPDTSKDKPA